MPHDKQLHGIRLEDVLEKRRLDQALNAKEFAVLAGISYSTAREWFRVPRFPVFRGVVFWQDFAQWRIGQHNGHQPAAKISVPTEANILGKLPPRAEKILHEA